MHSLVLKVDDGFYAQLLSFLNQNKQMVNIVEDTNHNAYSTIGNDEARRRVSTAVEEYRSGQMKTVPYSQGMDEIDKWLDNL